PGQHSKVNPAELRWIRTGDIDEPRRNATSEAIVAALPLPTPALEVADAGRWRALLTNRSLILLTVSYAAVGYFEYLFYFWMHFYFEGILKLGKYESRDYATILYLAMAVGMFLGGWLADSLARHWGRRRGRAAVILGGM